MREVSLPAVSERRRLEGIAMALGTATTIQIAGAVAHDLFDQVGATGVSAIRFVVGAAVLLLVARPTVRGRDCGTWLAVIVYGVSLAALNLTFFGALARIPQGIAVTLAFLAPLGMAIVRSRRRLDLVFAAFAVIGVIILGGAERPGSTLGMVLAILSGVSWLGVAFASTYVGARTERVDGLALALPVAALVSLPFGLPHAGSIDGHVLAVGALIGVIGLIVPFALELEALRRVEARVLAVVYSIDPAIAVVVAWIGLGETLSVAQWLGVVAVVAACGGTALGGTSRPAR